MTQSTKYYLRDIIRELDDIIQFTRDGENAFYQDVKTQKAVIRSYEVVGEICKRLPAEYREEQPTIDWRQLTHFRDFLAHNYELIALKYVWDAVTDVNMLRQKFQSLLNDIVDDQNE